MYGGSLVGSGACVFALMGYVIANMKPDKTVGMQVRLNAKVLAPIIGESEDDMQKAIDFLCEPDPHSTTPDEDGRRLIKVGTFDYRVVNGVKYQQIRDEEDRREKNRLRQREHRANIGRAKRPSRIPGESLVEKSARDGATAEDQSKLADQITDELSDMKKTEQPPTPPPA